MLRPAVILLLACACGGNAGGIAELGGGTHDASLLTLETMGTEADELDVPTDVSLNPNAPGTLWVTNYGANRVTVLDSGTWTSYDGPGSDHFLVQPMSLAFTDFGDFATIHDTDRRTQGTATPADFMGPVLWDDSTSFDGGHGGHLDMLHNTPLGGGIAWEVDRIFWVFDGANTSLTRYNFNDDHGYGGSDHSDGEIDRFAEGEVERIEGIPSHVDFDAASSLLFVSDTANNRIAVLDTTTGERGGTIGPNYDGVPMRNWNDADIWTLADGDNLVVALDDRGREVSEPTTLEQPAGLELDGDLFFVTDHQTSRVLAFNLDGELVDWVELDLPAGSLGGIEVGEEGELYVTNLADNTVLKITAAE